MGKLRGGRCSTGVVFGLLSVALACTPEALADGSGSSMGSASVGSTSSSAGSTSMASVSTSSGTTGSGRDSTGTSEESGRTFIDPVDGGMPPECTIFDQECPRGEKCTLGSSESSNGWDLWHCVPVAADPAGPGEPCTVRGSAASGLDDCALGSVCWGADPRTQEGVCVAFCEGNQDSPTCADEGSTCWIPADGLFAMCFSRCDPLEPICPGDFGCYPQDDVFTCRLDFFEEMGAPGDPCEFNHEWCDSGMVCVSGALVPGCEEPMCCSATCDLGDRMPACLPGQTCEPWDDDPPAEYQHVGWCGMPP